MWRILFLISVLFISGCGTSTFTPYTDKETGRKFTNCSLLIPRNPYPLPGGHFKGYQWGESGKSCGGNSQSFIEGCEEYERQKNSYNECLNK